MKRFIAILTVVLSLVAAQPVMAQLQWHETNREATGRVLNDPRQSDGIRIYGGNGVITIYTPRRITVKVYTILGQNVSHAVLNPGTSELKIGTRGIYIVRIGDLTQKVAI